MRSALPARTRPAGLDRPGLHPGSGRRRCPDPARPGPLHRALAHHRRRPVQRQALPARQPLAQPALAARTRTTRQAPHRQPPALRAHRAAALARTAHPFRQPAPPHPGRQQPGRAWRGNALSGWRLQQRSARWPATDAPVQRTRSGHPDGRTRPSASGAGRHAPARRPRRAPTAR
ncbi:hypothetical protein D3C80_947820 [compost metagenome]